MIKNSVQFMLILSSMSLAGMQKFALHDTHIKQSVLYETTTPTGMSIKQLSASLMSKTGTYVAGVKLFIFDCSKSDNLEKDKDRIATFVGTVSPYAPPLLLEQAELFFDVVSSVDNMRLNSKATLMKKRKHGDLRHGFKTHIMPLMDTTKTVIYMEQLTVVPEYQQGGLGKQVVMYLLVEALKQFPSSIAFWIAHPFGQHSKTSMNAPELANFYQRCGCTVVNDGSHFCYIDITKLNLGLFQPKSKL